LLTERNGEAMTEDEPAVSRLCVAAAALAVAPLSSIQESGRFYRLHVAMDPADGAEFAVATPGLDEVSLIADLIAAMRSWAALTPGLRKPVLAGFHVGLIRLTGNGFGGKGVERTLALIRDPAVASAAALAGARLAVAITVGLFEDLRMEGLADAEWQPVPTADAWLRVFDGTADDAA
jgi:hypothetical protein